MFRDMGRHHTVMSARSLARIVAGLGVITVVAAGCSSSKISAPTTTRKITTTTAAAETTTTAAVTTTSAASAPTTVGASTTVAAATTTAATDTASSAPGNTSGDGVDVWAENATQFKGQTGKTATIDCTPKGALHTIWGTETYTDDSSICTAAVQVGLITLDKGGSVEYQIAAGQDSYAGMLGNDVTSEPYGSWGGSFIFPKAPPGSGTFSASVATWSESAKGDDALIGQKILVNCSAKGEAGTVWGTGTYTSDSSICTAAVLQGLITVEKGGPVVAQVAPGQDSYKGSTANGITSNDYGSWGLSFTIPKDQTPPPSTVPTATT